MDRFSPADCRYMARALQLARRGMTTAHPNPRVGCVLVQGDRIVGEGWHRYAGEAHAEVNALAAAGTRAVGATAYVTLEPCSHTGRTGPCTEALIRGRIAEVIFALEDPSPEASGRARELLEEAGVRVSSGLMETAAGKLNEGFIMRLRRQRPFVRVKVAASLDGATAMRNGESRWITGDAARRDVQRLRATCGAIMTGIGTVVADDPLLTVRQPEMRNQPLRAVIDSRLRTPANAKLLEQPGETVLFCIADGGERQKALESAGAMVRRVAAAQGRVDLPAVLEELARLQVNDLLVEAGPVLAGALLAGNLVDELVIYQAPHTMGGETLRMFDTPEWTRLIHRRRLHITDTRRVGKDLRILARPLAPEEPH
ncbi:MAG: bifunctional diaminohydroxyphosphoribosylaminopyrimidine deaminase/5-amino-6-(5-phosphoribosylamino)uracil reductase RibD [Woeseia sp.]